MIVQCDQCSSKFRLDDAKVKEGGAKVRCSKCKHIFVVQKEAPAEEADFDSFLNGLVSPPLDKPGDADAAVPPAAEQPVAAAGKAAETEFFTAEEEAAGGGLPGKDGFDFGGFDFDAGPDSTPSAKSFEVEEKGGFDFGELNLESGDSAGQEAEAPERGAPAYDDGAFFFTEEPAPPAPEIEVTIEGDGGPGASGDSFDLGTAPPQEQEEAFPAASALDFSFEPEAEEPPAAPPAPEPKQGGAQPPAFDFGEFEFGDAAPSEKAEQAEEPPREPAEWEWDKPEVPAQEQMATPLAFEQPAVPAMPEMPMAEEELPPLSIPSRRKGSSILPIAVTAVSVLLVLALAGGGFYFFKEGPAAFNKLGLGFMASWFGLETKEEGGIAVRNPAAAFLGNKEAGEIFVVNGEAVNNFAKPRAHIQVKATLYGPKGEVLQQKSAYCGNALSREQLTTMPVAELEKAMGDQFGVSLSNLAVQPGKAIPFVVVFTNVPQGAAEFGVEVIGSTVASQ